MEATNIDTVIAGLVANGAEVAEEVIPLEFQIPSIPPALDVEEDLDSGMLSCLCPRCEAWVLVHPAFRFAGHWSEPEYEGLMHSDDMPNATDPGYWVEVWAPDWHEFSLPG